MSHVRHRFSHCCKTATFSSLLTKCKTHCACHKTWHFNVQKWCERGVCSPFWLQNALRATTGCTFWTSQFPKAALGSWGALNILTWKTRFATTVYTFWTSQSKSASEHLRTWQQRAIFELSCDQMTPHRFSSLFFDRPEPPSIEETLLRDFPTFTRTCIFFLPTRSFLELLLPLLLHLSISRKIDF